MKYIQFTTASTGYVNGSIPPRFNNSNIKPIDAIGSLSRRKLDGRYSLKTCIVEAHNYYALYTKNQCYLGFKIIEAADYREEGRVLYSWTDKEKFKKLKTT